MNELLKLLAIVNDSGFEVWVTKYSGDSYPWGLKFGKDEVRELENLDQLVAKLKRLMDNYGILTDEVTK